VGHDLASGLGQDPLTETLMTGDGERYRGLCRGRTTWSRLFFFLFCFFFP